jgi:glutamate racemase
LLGLEQQLRPFKDSEIDHLVLGCSHYPLALDQIKLFLKSEVKVIDSGFAVAKQTDRILVRYGLKSEKILKDNTLQIYTNKTSNTALKSVLEKLNLNDYNIINS